MDKLFIQNLAIQCRLGVHPHEQRRAQTIWIDVELQLKLGRAGATDRLADAVDYATIVRTIRTLCRAKPHNLMEALAERLARRLLSLRPIRRVTLRVKKRALPGLEHAGVEVTRYRRSAA
ncbi:MAG: dihydroneopterin aldolase [Candidatus Omnitrophica bacterium]|nr:dihydroneopterin aldolase [Candidatus Omnitrophota bacterium]